MNKTLTLQAFMVVIILSGSSWLGYDLYTQKLVTIEGTSENEKEIDPEENSEDLGKSSDWEVYEKKDIGLRVWYPESWQTTEGEYPLPFGNLSLESPGLEEEDLPIGGDRVVYGARISIEALRIGERFGGKAEKLENLDDYYDAFPDWTEIGERLRETKEVITVHNVEAHEFTYGWEGPAVRHIIVIKNGRFYGVKLETRAIWRNEDAKWNEDAQPEQDIGNSEFYKTFREIIDRIKII